MEEGVTALFRLRSINKFGALPYKKFILYYDYVFFFAFARSAL